MKTIRITGLATLLLLSASVAYAAPTETFLPNRVIVATTTAGCAQFASTGLLFSTGISCGTGGGGLSFGKSWEVNASGFLAPTTTIDVFVPVLRIDTLSDGCLNILSGVVGSQACGGGGGTNSKWATTTGTTITPNGGGGIFVDASSTITSLFAQQATTTVATSTNNFFSAFGRFPQAVILKLANLTGNGFVKTSGGDGTLSIDTTTYLSAAIQNLGPANQLQSGTTVTLATTSTAFNGLTASTTITGSGNTLTFANTLAGILGVGGGGTGATTFSSGQLLYGSGTGPVATVATTTAVISTGLSYSGTFGSLVGGVGGTLTNTGVISVGNGTGVTCSGTSPATCSLAAIAANSILANNTSGSAIPVALATSSFFSLTQPTTITYASTTAVSVSGALMVNNASSSINNLRVINDLVSFSSTTALDVLGALNVNNASSSINNLRVVNASSTALSVIGALMVNAASSSINNLSNVFASSTALSITGSLMVNAPTSTITNLVVQNGTTTNASSTALTVSGVASTTVLRIDRLNDGCLTMTTGLVGSAACSSSGTVSTGIAGQLLWYAVGGTTASGTSTNPLAVGSILATSSALTSVFAGNVGFGSTTPWAQLAINPNAGQASNKFVIGSSTATHLLVDNRGYIGIGTTSPWGLLSINPSGLLLGAPSFIVGSSTAANLIVDQGGRVGVGTTSPMATFAVNPIANQAPFQLLIGSSTATSLAILNTGKIYGGGFTKQISPDLYPSFTYSTTTAWTGTTTLPLGPAFVPETWSAVMCFTDVGTVGVTFYDGTNKMEWVKASTTIGTFGFATNNAFTAAETRYVDLGTPASSPTKISCTVKKSID